MSVLDVGVLFHHADYLHKAIRNVHIGCIGPVNDTLALASNRNHVNHDVLWVRNYLQTAFYCRLWINVLEHSAIDCHFALILFDFIETRKSHRHLDCSCNFIDTGRLNFVQVKSFVVQSVYLDST